MKKFLIFVLLCILYSCNTPQEVCVDPPKFTVVEPIPILKPKPIIIENALVTLYYTGIYKASDTGKGNGIIINYNKKNYRLFFEPGAVEKIETEGFGIVIVNTDTIHITFIIDHKFNTQPYIKGSSENKLHAGELAADENYYESGQIVEFEDGSKHKIRDVGKAIKGPNHFDMYIGKGYFPEIEKKANHNSGYRKVIVYP